MIPIIYADERTKTVTITGNKCSLTFKRGKIVVFDGLDLCYEIGEVFPNGCYLIDSERSIKRFYKWETIFATNDGKKVWSSGHNNYVHPGPSVFLDAIQITGMVRIK